MTTEGRVGPDHPASSASVTDGAEALPLINARLAMLGQPTIGVRPARRHADVAPVSSGLCPADRRIQNFLDAYLADVCPSGAPRLFPKTFVLDRRGLARVLSLPAEGDRFLSDIVSSYRVRQGVLHNPKADRRTTQGVFHVAEGGFPVSDDKVSVPKAVFAKLLEAAFQPTDELQRLPFTSGQEQEAKVVLSLLLRPIVCPEAPGFTGQKSMEIRFFAPGGLVSNLDFVESIFGNGGDPFLAENDAALDADRWTGHTGCVILAPHLITLRKKDLGLPRWQDATERQRRDGQCWKDEAELYNNGGAFKITARDERGVMVTILADNYYGYCKKEVKTQISFSANLFGLCEEEHSGGAVAFARYVLQQDFQVEGSLLRMDRSFEEAMAILGDRVDVRPEGYAVDRRYPNILYVPGNVAFRTAQNSVTWTTNGEVRKIKLLAGHTYVLPSGYKIHMDKAPGGKNWRLIGAVAEGTLCHKPCTVSGGGKSEISKPISYSMIQGPVFVRDFHGDLDHVEELIRRDYSDCFRVKDEKSRAGRPVLSPERSLGSVIKLFTPSPEYTDEHNAWLRALPNTILQLLFVIKRHYRPEWGENWREHFSVDRVNGFLGHELKYDGEKLAASYLRVGLDEEGAWRIFRVRSDFHAAKKVQVEDDITASIVVPSNALSYLNGAGSTPSVKIVTNCESHLFQRPDDAIHRGYDHQAEADLASPDTFLSNWEPLDRDAARDIMDDAVGFDQYTQPMKDLIEGFLEQGIPRYVVASSHPRMVDGKPSKNPRYLQKRPDRVNHRETYLAEVGTRLARGVPAGSPVVFPVNAVLAGRRNNPPEPKIELPALAVYNPIHYQELPELFTDFICSLTGKSPSTTGFGSEGALTKGPFNALWPIVDLNNALVSFILTGYAGFTSAAGYVGPKFKVDHDISLLIPEIWCRMSAAERDPAFLIKSGMLERLQDFDHGGRRVPASLLGYRITSRFVDAFLGRLFETPNLVFTEEMLKPELQGMELFVEGLEAIVEAQRRVASHYFADGSVDAACPPLKALLHVMAKGAWEGKGIDHPDVRGLFRREAVIASDWYRERLQTKQARDAALYERQVADLEAFRKTSPEDAERLQIVRRLENARRRLADVRSPAYLQTLTGTIGADPFHGQLHRQAPPAATARA